MSGHHRTRGHKAMKLTRLMQQPSARSVALLALLGFPAVLLAAQNGTEDSINWFQLMMELLGGLAMFLFGMEQMSDGLKGAAGDTLKDVLAKLTRNRFMAAITGAFVTAILNSSSVTTVLVVGFISAGFMSLSQSIGIIMGANIGSTFTAQIIAFNVTQYALIMVAVGFYLLFAGRQEKSRYYGAMIMGLGLVFYGMGVMGDAMYPLRTYEPFIELMRKMENPLLGILVGAIFTGLVQSSAATTGIAIVMATEGLITLPAGIALAFGANIGTCVTALLAAIGKPVDAKRAAAVHTVFNIAGVLVWVMFIPYLVDFVVAISPASADLTGRAKLAAEVPRQIANAHTIFNVANTLLFIGFTHWFARLVVWLVPDKPPEEKIIVKPKYLDDEVTSIPAIALERVRAEIGHMGEITVSMMSELKQAMQDRDRKALDDVLKLDDKVDILHEAILEYLAQIRRETLTDRQSREFQALMGATVNLEGLADVIESELVGLGKQIIDSDMKLDDATSELFSELGGTVTTAVEQVIKSIRESDEQAAQAVIQCKDDIRRMADMALASQSERMSTAEAGNIPMIMLEFEMLDNLRRVYTLAKRIAKDFVPEEVAEKA